jgi:hypothetical protein
MKVDIDNSQLINDIAKREIREDMMCFLISIYDLI